MPDRAASPSTILPPPHVSHDFKSAEEAFDHGNYVIARDLAVPGSELAAAATILCGAVQPGLAALGGGKSLSERGRLAAGYGRWCLDNVPAALAVLTGAESAEGKALAAAVAGPPIDIALCHMPGSDKAAAFADLPGFRVHRVALEPDRFGCDWQTALAGAPAGFDPVFALSVDAYGVYVPRGRNLPVLYWASDNDYFIATRYRDFAGAAAILVNSAAEQAEMSAIYGVRTATLPGHEFYGVLGDPSEANKARSIDVLFTGRAFVPYMRDKAQYLFRLATLADPDLEMRIIDDYLPDDDYAAATAGAKQVPLFWRYAGGIQTRAIDALSRGARVLSPESGLCAPLIGGWDGGYDSLAGMTDAEIVARLKTGAPPPQSDAFGAMFWPSPAREARLMKFAYLQWLLSKERPNAGTGDSSGPAPVELRGYDAERGTRVYSGIIRLNTSEVEHSAAAAIASASAALYGAVLLQSHDKMTALAHDLHVAGAARFPNSLVMQFNSGCALWLLNAREDARRYFARVAGEGNRLEFDPRTDALHSHRIRLLAEMLPYGDYYRTVAEGIAEHAEGLATARAIIVATALAYLDRCEEAIAAYPDHSPAWRRLAENRHAADAGPDAVLEAFYRAIALYPPYLAPLLPIGVAAEEALGQADAVRDLIEKWVLFAARTRDAQGRFKFADANAFAVAETRATRLSGWIGEMLNHMKTMET